MRIFTTKKHKLMNDQQGMVAIVVTMVLMTVVSIITIGFVQVTIREQRQVTDRQLASQALYAAESGINLAESKLAAGQGNKPFCPAAGVGSTFAATDYEINASRNIEITCLLINNQPETAVFQNVGGDSRITQLRDANNETINDIFVAWSSTSSSTIGCAAADVGNFPVSSGAWTCGQPLVRVDIVPLCPNDTDSCLTQAALRASQYTAFLYPTNGGAKPTSIPYANGTGANLGANEGVGCTPTVDGNNPGRCIAQITTGGARAFAVRVQSFYGNADITLYATSSAGRVKLINSQAIIDVTAQAVDVTRRLQVRKPLAGSTTPANAALTAGGLGLCKLFFVTGTSVNLPAGTVPTDSTDPCSPS